LCAIRRAHAQPALPLRAKAPTTGVLPGRSAFLRRIPAKLGTDLIYIEVEDHYLGVHTNLGSDLILFRMSDAVAELDPMFGRQVHRSYWVAKRGVASIERDRYRIRLLLTTGVQIPVSRTYLPALREAGWL
jgi:DNA-binding LytR/AlgR family response regulator